MLQPQEKKMNKVNIKSSNEVKTLFSGDAFEITHNDKYGTFIIDIQRELVYLIAWDEGFVGVSDVWDAEKVYDIFSIEDWFESVLHQEEEEE